MYSLKINNGGWAKSSSDVFWGEIAPCEHIVQIYENDESFLDLLTGFVSGGINAGECAVVIATTAHLKALDERLAAAGYAVPSLISETQYIPLDAEETLSKFMVNDWPDEYLFHKVISEVIVKAKGNNRNVRAFGEMVAILWAKGQVGATVRLEHLWNKFCENEAFCLFCAYPESGFTQDAAESVMHICSAHTKMITGAGKGNADVFYKVVEQKRAN
ncbi:MEDS domain-containing protein [Longitalea luteola]|uniref:MEDS domain-containing protein n=1 Tax=Longitalea luteola TaxID=2812563 RepID=UPI001A9776C2|nr:MEDS domain-containing protein [Longitalea luteola]